MRLMVVIVGWSGLVLGGCATLDRGSTDKFYVISDPPGARMTLSTGASCVTPCGVAVGRRDTFTATIEKAGYRTKAVEVGTRLTASGVGDLGENIVTGGAGAVVDVATGAALEHVPNPLRVTLPPVAGRPGAADNRRTP